MKARVKATGEIVEILEVDYTADNGLVYYEEDLCIEDKSDYWEKLHHQAAIAAMQGILSNKELFNTITEGVWPPNRPAYIAARCDEYSTALVNKLKEESQC